MTRPIVLQGDTRAVARTGIGTFVSVIFGAGVAFSTTLFVSKTVGDEGAGVFFQILAFFAIASTACTFGADTGLVRILTAQLTLGHRGEVWKTFVVALVPVTVVAGVAAAAVWFSAPAFASLFHDPHALDLIRLLALFIPPGSLLTAIFGGLRGFGRVGTFTGLQNVALPCLRFTAVAAVVVLGLGTLALAAAWVVPVALILVVAATLLRGSYHTYLDSAGTAQDPAAGKRTPGVAEGGSGVDGSSASTAALFRKFWSFSAGRGASSLLEIILEWIDVILVGLFLGPAAAGVYGVVNRCVRLGQMADHSARIVVGPMLGAAMAAGDRLRTQSIYLVSTRLLILVAWPFYLVLLLGGPTLLSLFGPVFVDGYPALVIISVAMALAVTAGGVQSVLLMAGRSRWQLYNKLAALAVALTGNLLLIPLLGLRGAASSWAAAVLVDCALATWEVHHFLRIRVSLRSISLPAVLALSVYGAGLGLVVAVFGPAWWVLSISLSALTVLYGTLVWRLRVPLGLVTLRRPA
ncbi:lipopolysaccharide biosynthesis protein [Arthrobacter psychrochitiniphilus]|uniref:lipopolysaccharide biosynthesis protein n=1 Tax=Arthrobacter psychrochitiniphilus TaxID=291045 RepID=UPI003F7C4ABA